MKLNHGFIVFALLSTFSFAKINLPIPSSTIQKIETKSSKESLQLFFFDVGQGHFSLLKQGDAALIIDAGSSNKKFSDIKSTFEKHLGNATIKAVILTQDTAEHRNFLKKLRQHYCDEACVFLNIYKQKIRLSHAKNYCEYLSLFDSTDLQQLASFFKGIFPSLTFSFPVHLKQFNPTKIEDSSLTFAIEYQHKKLLFTGNTAFAQFNHLIDFKQKYTDPAKKQLILENTNIFRNINLIKLPTAFEDQEKILQWISSLTKENAHQPIFVIGNIPNTISSPKNNLQVINPSQGTICLKVDIYGSHPWVLNIYK